MNRTATLTIAVLAAATVAAPGALAAPKPITKTYTATAPMADPSNFAGTTTYGVCGMNVPQSFHTEEFKVPAAGSLKINMTGYVGDWDLLLTGDKGQELATGGAGDLGVPEVMQVKFKKPTTVAIIACNWAGGPTGTVKYTFTYK